MFILFNVMATILLNVALQYLKDKAKNTKSDLDWTPKLWSPKPVFEIFSYDKWTQQKCPNKRHSKKDVPSVYIPANWRNKKKDNMPTILVICIFFSAKENSLVNVVFSGRNIAVCTSISVTFILVYLQLIKKSSAILSWNFNDFIKFWTFTPCHTPMCYVFYVDVSLQNQIFSYVISV